MSCSALAGPPALLSPQISSRALESAACKVGETECCSSSAVRSGEELLYINIVLLIVLVVVVVVEDFVSPVKAAAAARVSGVDVLASATFVMALMSSLKDMVAD